MIAVEREWFSMKQYKRIISLLIVIASLTSAVPQVMAADAAEISAQSAVVYSTEVSETAVAVVNGEEYGSLEDAVNAAPANGVVTLYKDTEISKKISVSKNVTIEASESAEAIYIKRAASFTDSMFEVSGGAVLTLGGTGSKLIADGGAVWNESGSNEGISASAPLIYINTGRLTVQRNAVIQNNHNSSGEGGAVYTKGGGSAVINVYGTIQNNRSAANGGAISGNCYVNIYDGSVFADNKADSNGGSVYIYSGGVAEIRGGTFTGNSAGGNGGVVWMDGKTTITGGTFTGNSAQNGGALYIAATQPGRAGYIYGGSFNQSSSENSEDIYISSNYCYFKGGFNAENIYLQSGKKFYIQGAISGSAAVSTGSDLTAEPQIAAGSGYSITAADAEKIKAYSDICETVYRNGGIALKYYSIKVTSQPEDKIVYMGSDAALTFEITKPEYSGEAVYTWYRCSDINGSNPEPVSNDKDYHASTAEAGTGYYYCEITADKAGNARTNVVVVKVMDPESAELPLIVKEPEDKIYGIGETITLSCEVKQFDNGTLSYQWYRSETGEINPEADEKISGATSAEYTFAPDSDNTAYYYLVAVNRVGNTEAQVISRAAKVECGAAAYIIGAVQDGSRVRIEYENIAVGDVSYKWLISDSADGAFSDTGVREQEFAPESSQIGKYIKAVVTANGIEVESKAKQIMSAGTYNEYSGNYIYFSDIPVSQQIQATVGWETLKYDTNISDDTISLMVGGTRKYFTKGLGAHAYATLIYDVEELTDNYRFTRFTSYLGVDASRGNAGSVKFILSVSDNLSDWHVLKETGTLTGSSEAEYVDIDLTGVKYFKIYIDHLGSASSDHSVIAGAKLSRADYIDDQGDYEWIKKVSEYDDEIRNYEAVNSGKTYSEMIEDPVYRNLIYSRSFVKSSGYDYLQAVAHTDETSKAALEWFMNDMEAMEMYITGGYPSGTYARSIKVLMSLYSKHGDDINDSEFGQLYKRMMITLSLTHSTSVGFWADSSVKSDPVRRYEIYKKLHDSDLLLNSVFEHLNVEEMRWVLGDLMDDDEIEWLNFYSRKTNTSVSEADYNSSNFTKGPYHYIKYTMGFNYYQDKYYSAANKEMWQSKYFLTQEYAQDDRFEINIPYDYNKPKLWTVFAEGAVCGGISKTGTNLLTVFGVPGVVVGQPGHAAYLRYIYSDNNTEGGPATWSIWNNISGWVQSEKGERLLCGWGSKNWDSAYQVSYVLLAQAALNDEENYNKALTLVKAAEQKSDPEERIKIYEEALAIQSINLDAWENMIYAYNESGKSSEDYLQLASRISDSLTYYPLPMWDIIEKLVKPHVTSTTQLADLALYEHGALKRASAATSANTLQPNDCKVMADHLLGKNNLALATFSFTGNNANKIMLTETYANSGNQLLYSLTGNSDDAWINAGEVKEVQLTPEQVELVTPENGILVRLQGTTNYYTITISKQNTPTGIYLNDTENRLIKSTSGMEWSYDKIKWTQCSDTTRFPGETTVYLRTKAADAKIASDALEYHFTADVIDPKRSYITLDNISIAGYSSAEDSKGGNAVNAIDGNINTVWHTVWAGTDPERSITLKINEPKYLSALEYTPRTSGTNGIFQICDIYTSLDGSSWYHAGTASWSLNNSEKKYSFESPVYAQYIKLVGTKAGGNYGSAAMIELFEDTTVADKTINSIVLESAPSKLNYVTGEELDTTGIKVKAEYDDGSTAVLPSYMLSYSKTVFETEGTETVYISAPIAPDAEPVSFNVTVSENTKTPVSLSIVSMPKKTEYSIGETFDMNGLSVRAHYEDGSKAYISNDKLTITPSVFESEGEQVVTISCKGAETTLTVTVQPGFAVGYLRFVPIEGSCYVNVIGYSAGDLPEDGKIEIPSKVMIEGCEYDVIGISENAFSGEKSIRSVVFPKTLTSISDRAFYGCDNLSLLDFTAFSSFEDLVMGSDIFGTDTSGVTIGGSITVASDELASEFPSIASGDFTVKTETAQIKDFAVLGFDSGYYLEDGEKRGIIRFYAKPNLENITRFGFVYVDSNGSNGNEIAADADEDGVKDGFTADVFDIYEDFGDVNVKAFVVADGEKIFSDIINGKVNFNRKVNFE